MNWLSNYLTPDIAQEVFKNKDLRLQLCEKYIFFFGLLYFPHYFTHEPAPFHLGMCKDLTFEGYQHLIWEMFRESSKTSWAKIKVIHNIVFKKRMYNLFACFEKQRAEANVYDIAVQLQTNQDLIRDFDQLFFEDSLSDEKKSTKKSIKEFICKNGVKVQAISTGMSTRGLVYQQYRPDFYVIDDFETSETARSATQTKSVIEWFGELLAGLAVDAQCLYLCNKISNFGSVSWLEQKARNNPNFKLRVQPVKSGDKIAWAGKFVETDEEAKTVNALIANSKEWKFSLESKKRDLGESTFQAEMMLNPRNAEDCIIKDHWITDNYYDIKEEWRDADYEYYIAADSAIGQKKLADFTGIFVLARNVLTGRLFNVEVYAIKKTVDEQADFIIGLWRKYKNKNLRVIGVETVMTMQALYQVLETKSAQGLYLPLQRLTPQGKDKTARMQAIEHLIQNGMVKFHPYQAAFHDQLLSFPNQCEHDDMVDAFMYAVELATHGMHKEDSSVEDEVNKQLNGAMTIAGNIMDMAF